MRTRSRDEDPELARWKAAGSVGLKYRSSWERLAVVTDKNRMRHAIAAFGRLMPGQILVFEPGELE